MDSVEFEKLVGNFECHFVQFAPNDLKWQQSFTDACERLCEITEQMEQSGVLSLSVNEKQMELANKAARMSRIIYRAVHCYLKQHSSEWDDSSWLGNKDLVDYFKTDDKAAIPQHVRPFDIFCVALKVRDYDAGLFIWPESDDDNSANEAELSSEFMNVKVEYLWRATERDLKPFVEQANGFKLLAQDFQPVAAPVSMLSSTTSTIWHLHSLLSASSVRDLHNFLPNFESGFGIIPDMKDFHHFNTSANPLPLPQIETDFFFGESAQKPLTDFSEMWVPEGYEISGKLGQGAQAAIALLKSTTNGQFYAGKCLRDYNAASKRINEIRILSRLNHQNILRFMQCFAERGKPVWIILEYCQNGDLAQLIKSRRAESELFGLKEIKTILFQLMKALAYLHQLKIVHRDIKPANVFLANHLLNRVDVKLGDFGLACFENEIKADSLVGTICYMAPERIRLQSYGTAADVWSAGCILHELCHLKRLFLPLSSGNQRIDDMTTALAIDQWEASVALSAFESDTLDEAFLKLMSPNPRHRIEAADFLQSYESYFSSEDTLKPRTACYPQNCSFVEDSDYDSDNQPTRLDTERILGSIIHQSKIKKRQSNQFEKYLLSTQRQRDIRRITHFKKCTLNRCQVWRAVHSGINSSDVKSLMNLWWSHFEQCQSCASCTTCQDELQLSTVLAKLKTVDDGQQLSKTQRKEYARIIRDLEQRLTRAVDNEEDATVNLVYFHI